MLLSCYSFFPISLPSISQHPPSVCSAKAEVYRTVPHAREDRLVRQVAALAQTGINGLAVARPACAKGCFQHTSAANGSFRSAARGIASACVQ
jgi:hypothetical protein